MNRKELSQNHWKYYLMLEKRFVESIEFVELHEDNFDAFSNGYALLIQAIGAELDTVFKEFCGFNTTDRKTVADYAQYILTNTPDIKNQKISVQEYDIEIQPFMNWDITQPAQSLQWWGAFTDVKHNRYEQLKQAKQENVLNILGALYLIEMLYLKKITDGTDEFDVFDESSNLFSLKNWTSKAVPLSQAFAVLSDMMDDENNTRAIKGCSITVKQKTALCQGKGRGLSFNLRVYIQLQFLDKFRGFRSKQGLHIQSGHCRSDNPVLTADTYCRQPRFPPQTYQWQSCCHQKISIPHKRYPC